MPRSNNWKGYSNTMERLMYSIIVPVYNAEEYVERCVSSVLSQTYQNFELLLIDDGSTDKSGDICDDLESKDDRIQVFHNNNQRQLRTRLFGISKAVGDVVVFVDSDDYVDSRLLSKINIMFESYECDMVMYEWSRVTDYQIVSSSNAWTDIRIFDADKLELYSKILLKPDYNSMCQRAIKRTLLLQDNTNYSEYLHLRTGEDFVQSLFPLFHANKVCYIPDKLYYYYVNEESITRSKIYNRYLDIFKSREAGLKYIKQYIGKLELLNDYADVIKKMVCHQIIEILYSNMDFKKQLKIFEDIKRQPFYKSFVYNFGNCSEVDGFLKLIYTLFNNKNYYSLFFIVKFRKMISILLKNCRRIIGCNRI